MLGIAVALAAVVTMPVCQSSAFFPVTDGDARTITERRDIVEVVSDPGVHLLHLGYEIANHCETCIGTDLQAHPFDGSQTSHVEDIAQRVATVPAASFVEIASDPRDLHAITATLHPVSPRHLSPPPR